MQLAQFRHQFKFWFIWSTEPTRGQIEEVVHCGSVHADSTRQNETVLQNWILIVKRLICIVFFIFYIKELNTRHKFNLSNLINCLICQTKVLVSKIYTIRLQWYKDFNVSFSINYVQILFLNFFWLWRTVRTKNSGIGRRLLDSSYNFTQPNTHETQTFWSVKRPN